MEAGCCVNQVYASKIQETADGSRRGPGREARGKEKIVAQRRFQEHGEFDEQERAQENSRDEAQESAEEKEELRFLSRVDRSDLLPSALP